MINLLATDIDIDSARKAHVDYFTCYVRYRLKRKKCINDISKTCINCKKIPKKKYLVNNNIQVFLTDRIISKILLGTPKELIAVQVLFLKLLLKLFKKSDLKEYEKLSISERKLQYNNIYSFYYDINALFNYDYFSGLSNENSYSAYHLAENLNVRSIILPINRTV